VPNIFLFPEYLNRSDLAKCHVGVLNNNINSIINVSIICVSNDSTGHLLNLI